MSGPGSSWLAGARLQGLPSERWKSSLESVESYDTSWNASKSPTPVVREAVQEESSRVISGAIEDEK
jgi:hypothetical protein